MLPRPHGRGGNGHLEGNIFFFISVYNGLVQVNSGGFFCLQLLSADLPPYVRCSDGGPFPVLARRFKAAVAAYLTWMEAGREEEGEGRGVWAPVFTGAPPLGGGSARLAIGRAAMER